LHLETLSRTRFLNFAGKSSDNLGERFLGFDTEFVKKLGLDTFLPMDSLTGFKLSTEMESREIINIRIDTFVPGQNGLDRLIGTEVAKRLRRWTKNEKEKKKEQLGYNISYPSSAAAVVFGVYLSARAVYRLDRKSPAIRPCV